MPFPRHRRGRCVCAPVIVAWLVLLACGWLTSPAFANPVQDENALPGATDWARPLAPSTEIEGYAGQDSVAPGDTVDLHVRSGPVTRYRVEVYRLGWYGGLGAREVLCLPDCASDRAPASQPPPPPPDRKTGEVDAGWSVTDTFTVPSDWMSGYYLVEFVVTSGPASGQSRWTPLIVRPPTTRHPHFVVQAPVNTWQAYNGWGGKSLYRSNSTLEIPATHVSFNRPYGEDPAEAPTLFDFDYQLIRFLEREGADVGYVTDLDVERDPGVLMRSRLAMSAGHDEYWTKGQRDAFDSALGKGTNLAFMGANDAYWQVRWSESTRTMVGYKDQFDPIADRTLATKRFRDLGRPECEMLGVEYGTWATDNEIDRAFTVTAAGAADPWFSGSGLTAGTVLPESVGYEWDTADWPGCGATDRTILLHRDPEARDVPDRAESTGADAVRSTAPSGARIFAAGSLQFSWLLDGDHQYAGSTYYASRRTQGADPGVQHFVRNALDDLGRPASPTGATAELADGGVAIEVDAPPDPRVRLRVLRHPGPQPFAPGDPGVVVACDVAGSSCADTAARRGSTYRYAVVAADEWTTSAPVLLGTVTLPDAAPAVAVDGPASVPADTDATFRATVTDPDDSDPGVEWAVDGAGVGTRGTTLSRSFATPGEHDVAVTVDDGHGATAHTHRTIVVDGRPEPSVTDDRAGGTTAAGRHVVSHPPPAIRGRPASRSTVRSPSFAFSSPGSSRFECALSSRRGAAAFAPCSSPKRYRGLGDGSYVFRVRSDPSSPASIVRFTIGAKAPARHRAAVRTRTGRGRASHRSRACLTARKAHCRRAPSRARRVKRK
jgi:hypothetical protein